MQLMRKIILSYVVGISIFMCTSVNVYADSTTYHSAIIKSVNTVVLPQTLVVDIPSQSTTTTILNDRAVLQVGDRVYVQKNISGDTTDFTLFEIQKLSVLWGIFLLFVIIVLIINGLRGIRSIISLAGTTALTLFGLLPLIAYGFPPILTTIIFAAFILAIALFVTHGFNRGSLLAYVGSVLAVVCAGALASLALSLLQLSAVPTEELAYLTAYGFSFEVVGAMLFAGIIVGTLGVVDDVAITQIAIVRELRHTDAKLDLPTLFTKAMRVGREHVGALVNTLAFAYIGASLPLFVLLSMAPEGIIIALQKEPVIIEIVRIWSGSIGVLLVVPIATALAVFYSRPSDTDNTTHTHHGHSHF